VAKSLVCALAHLGSILTGRGFSSSVFELVVLPLIVSR
jgi:hypothetical protein